MAVSKMTAALVGLLVPGILAVTPYSESQTTVTAEPEQIGSTTSDGVLVYSMNYCTIVQSTACQVSLSTADVALPEPSAVAPTAAEEPSAVVSVPASAPGTGETVISGEPAPTAITEAAPEAPQPGEPGVGATSDGQPTPAVISTTDNAGNPTFVTSTTLAVTGFITTASGSAVTTGAHSNSTSHEGSSGTAAGPSAPDHTSASAALNVLPGVVLGVAAMAMACLL